MPAAKVTFGPQSGPQTKFLASTAQIAIFGGAAGGGKSYGLVLDAGVLATKHKNFGATIFRRTSKMVMTQGGLWDTSEEIYPYVGGQGTKGKMRWEFSRTNASVMFAHLEHEKNRRDYQGAQIDYIGFDELTHFTDKQFWYLVGRNRSASDAPSLIRATTNPDPDHFVRKIVDWWVDNDTGYAIPSRSGKIRYLARVGDDIFWASKREELLQRFGPDQETLSVTFIASKLEDNPLLLQKKPDYLAKLMSLPTFEREQLRFGNWNVRPESGSYFKRHFLEIYPEYPRGYRTLRVWDRAGTERKRNNDPDWTCGLKLTRDPDGIFWVVDVIREQLKPFDVEKLIKQTAQLDGPEVEIVVFQDPGSAGEMEMQSTMQVLAGYAILARLKFVSKEIAAKPASSQAEVGNIRLVAGEWNDAFVNELVNFPKGDKDDQVDCLSAGVGELTLGAQPLTEDSVVMEQRRRMGLTKKIFRPRMRF